MTRDELIRMAREAADKDKVDPVTSDEVCVTSDGVLVTLLIHEFERLAKMIAEAACKECVGQLDVLVKAEREACAKLMERDDSMRWSGAADAIRARGEK